MAKIIVRHEMFNIRRGSFRTSVQSNSLHCILNVQEPFIGTIIFP
jgi:hypothetical protein